MRIFSCYLPPLFRFMECSCLKWRISSISRSFSQAQGKYSVRLTVSAVVRSIWNWRGEEGPDNAFDLPLDPCPLLHPNRTLLRIQTAGVGFLQRVAGCVVRDGKSQLRRIMHYASAASPGHLPRDVSCWEETRGRNMFYKLSAVIYF